MKFFKTVTIAASSLLAIAMLTGCDQKGDTAKDMAGEHEAAVVENEAASSGMVEDAAAEDAQDTMGSMMEGAEDTMDSMMEGAEEGMDTMAEGAEEGMDTMAEGAEEAMDTMTEDAEKTTHE